MNVAPALQSFAADVMGARALASTITRTDVAGTLYRYADEAAEIAATIETPGVAEAVGLRYVMNALNDVAIMARRYGAHALADRLDRASQVAASLQDTAQLRLRDRLGLGVDYRDPENLGAKLTDGCASVLELLAVERFETPHRERVTA